MSSSPYRFITSLGQKRSSAWCWSIGLCAVPGLLAALAMTGLQIKETKKIGCSLMSTDYISLGLVAASLLLILYPLLSSGPAKPLRFLPFSYPLHLTLLTTLLVLCGLGCWKSSSSCSSYKTSCPAQAKLVGQTPGAQWKFRGKVCEVNTKGVWGYVDSKKKKNKSGKGKVVRDLVEGMLEGLVQGPMSGGPVLVKRKGGGGGGKKKGLDSKEEEGRFACWIVAMIFIAVWLWLDILFFYSDVKAAKQAKKTEAEAEGLQSSAPVDEEAAATKTYTDVETAYKAPGAVPYEPSPASYPDGAQKEGVNVHVNEVR